MSRNIMVIGTSSEVGKTSISLAISKWLASREVKVAPFKSMSVGNSHYPTPGGGRVHIHQAQQALAIGIDPEPEMNPVVLATDNGHLRIIVRGQVSPEAAALHVVERTAYLRPIIVDSYRKLAGTHEFIVIEGCGSPVELNLRERDLVNFWVADTFDAPCILVANIENAGVFSAIVGVLTLLTPSERGRISGIIINKFHGDVDEFDDGLRILRERTGIERIGIVPFLEGLRYIGKENGATLPSAAFLQEVDHWTRHVEKFLGSNYLKAVLTH